MFNGSVETKPDEQGEFFIDRNPKAFDVILDYLRGETISVEHLDAKIIRKLILDAEYYNLPLLKKALNPTQQRTENSLDLSFPSNETLFYYKRNYNLRGYKIIPPNDLLLKKLECELVLPKGTKGNAIVLNEEGLVIAVGSHFFGSSKQEFHSSEFPHFPLQRAKSYYLLVQFDGTGTWCYKSALDSSEARKVDDWVVQPSSNCQMSSDIVGINDLVSVQPNYFQLNIRICF